MMKRGRAVFAPGCTLAALVVLSPAPARADNGAVAEALFRDATKLLESGNVDEACPKLAESQKIDPALGTLLYLAACHEKQGRTASAWSEFSSAKQWAERQNQHERAAFAQKHMTALEARLFSIVLATPTTIPGLELLVDGGLLSAAAAGTPLPLDPGDHQVAARAPGYEEWHATITVPAEAGKVTVTVPELKPAPVAASSPATSAGHGQPSSASQPVLASDRVSTSGASVSRVPMWISLGVAVAGVGVGSAFGLLTFSARDSAKSQCKNNLCVGSGLSDIDRAKTDATVSTIGFGVGIVAAAGAVYFGLRSGGHDSPAASVAQRPRLRVLPGVASIGAGGPEGAGTGGLTLVGQFD